MFPQDAENRNVQHPVDSTYYSCCNVIGRHGRGCAGLPAEILQEASAAVDRTRRDVGRVQDGLSADAGLFVSLDMVTALDHLRRAAVLIDRCADSLDSGSSELAR